MHPNDTSREAKPGLGAFKGKAMGLLVAGVMLGVSIFRVLDFFYVDLLPNIVISSLPLAFFTAVMLFLRDKPASYAGDLLLLCIWRMKTSLYMAGGLERPPVLWIENKVSYPKEIK
jgi:hypothetical protein